MAQKSLIGKVVSTKMTGSVTVAVSRKTPHPLYRKLITVTKKFIVGTNGKEVHVGDTVTISEVRKTGANKYFEIKKEGGTSE